MEFSTSITDSLFYLKKLKEEIGRTEDAWIDIISDHCTERFKYFNVLPIDTIKKNEIPIIL